MQIYNSAMAAKKLGLALNSMRRYAVLYGVGERLGDRWLFTDEDLAVIKEHMDRGRGRPPADRK